MQKLLNEWRKFLVEQADPVPIRGPKGCVERSDGCSGVPDKFGGRNWRSCCVEHDCCYEQGGDKAAREKCDADLEKCINRKAGPGTLYAFFVRKFGGGYFTSTKKKLGQRRLVRRVSVRKSAAHAAAPSGKRIKK